MFHDLATPVQTGLFRRLSVMLGFAAADKPAISPCPDRMSALNDPATRRELAKLPSHLLEDIGVRDQRPSEPRTDRPDGEALRNHMW
jgi:hypothetical protein